MAITLRAALRNAKATSPSGKVQNEDWQDFVDSAVLRVSEVADGGVAHYLDTDVEFTSGTLLEVRNNGSAVASIDYAGNLSAANLNVSNWNTAYGWGDHGAAGYASAASLAAYLPLAGGSMSGALLHADGAVGAPSISFASDTDTGIYLAAAGVLRFATAGTLRTAFDSNGFTLYNNGALRWSGYNIIQGVNGAGVITLRSWASADFDRLQFGGTDATYPSVKRSGAALQVRLADDSAFAALHLNSLENGGSGNIDLKTTSANNIRFATNSSTRFYIDSSGNFQPQVDNTYPMGTATRAFSAVHTHHLAIQGSDGAGASAGTLANAPSAGDPAEWIPVEFNGVTRYIPAWA